jgi:hypothetical protein
MHDYELHGKSIGWKTPIKCLQDRSQTQALSLSTSSTNRFTTETQTRFPSESTEALGLLGRNGSQRGTCHDVQDPDGRRKIIVRSCIRTAKKQRTYVSITTRERLQCSSHQQRRRLRKEGALPTFDASDLFGPSSPCQMMRETRENHSDRFIGTGTGRGPQAQPPETPTYTMETQGRRDLR